MTAPVGGFTPPSADAPRGDDAALRRAARQLAGVFAQQLFKAMRETVPKGEGVVDGGSGEEMFTGMLDEQLSGAAPGRGAAGGAAGTAAAERWTHDLADAVYRRLRVGVTPPAADASLGVPPSALR